VEEVIRVESQTVRFFDGLEVDGYRLPDGEFRVGLTGASRMLGYGENWLRRVLGRGGTALKALRGLGFTEQIEEVVRESERGARVVRTILLRSRCAIGLRDFNRLIAYAVADGKKAALALQLALTEVALNDFFVDAFGEPPLTIDQKRRLFYEAYAATISPENWREMDREDILRLALPGDESHLRWGFWNAWRGG
jgi:hypothetical protein